MVQDDITTEQSQQTFGLSAGAIVATAVAAGVIAFMIRRARRSDEDRLETAADIAAQAWDRARDADFRERTATATRDFMVERVLPEMKPVLLDLLKDVKGYVDQGFSRAEKAIKGM